MSLRILVTPDRIEQWIAARQGTPARRRGSETDWRILFDEENGDYERLDLEELVAAMRFHHLVVLVDEEPGNRFHRIYGHA